MLFFCERFEIKNKEICYEIFIQNCKSKLYKEVIYFV